MTADTTIMINGPVGDYLAISITRRMKEFYGSDIVGTLVVNGATADQPLVRLFSMPLREGQEVDPVLFASNLDLYANGWREAARHDLTLYTLLMCEQYGLEHGGYRIKPEDIKPW